MRPQKAHVRLSLKQKCLRILRKRLRDQRRAVSANGFVRVAVDDQNGHAAVPNGLRSRAVGCRTE